MTTKFECRKCGRCCTLFRLFPEGNYWSNELDSGDGTCKYFDRSAKLCSIYETRPIICNNAKYFDEYLKERMTREEFDVFLNTFCERIRNFEI